MLALYGILVAKCVAQLLPAGGEPSTATNLQGARCGKDPSCNSYNCKEPEDIKCPKNSWCKTDPYINFNRQLCEWDHDCPGICTSTPPTRDDTGRGPEPLLPPVACGKGYARCPNASYCRIDPRQSRTLGLCVRYRSCGGFTPFPSLCLASDHCIDHPGRKSCGMACDAMGICAPVDDWSCGGMSNRTCPYPLQCYERNEAGERQGTQVGWPTGGFCL